MYSTVERIYVSLRRIVGMATLICIVSIVGACSLDDARDLCCDTGRAMRYSYRPYGAEAFSGYIFSLRHFLYDDSGNSIGEIPPGQNLRLQPLELGVGEYLMVTVGNMSEISLTGHGGGASIDSLTLVSIASYEDSDDTLSNGDELYWGVKRFVIDGRGMAMDAGRQSEAIPVTYMNNIHCHLAVRVEWDNVPPYVGDYEMELDGVPVRYTLHPDLAHNAGGFVVPDADRLGVHRLRVPLRSQVLTGEFVTLRYANDAIPVLRLFFGSEQVSPDIDLGRAFRIWGWSPSDTHVQNYAVTVRIYGDGRADIYPRISATIDDWINGGSFS